MADLFTLSIDPPLDLIFQGLAAKVDNLPEVLNEVGTAFFEDDLPPFLDELSAKPGRAITMIPSEWQSPLQYRAHLASLNWGWGIPYHRDDKGVSESWLGSVATSANALEVRVQNTDPDAAYIYGGFSDDSGKPQQQFHAKTGWPLARPMVVEFYLRTAREVAPKIWTSWWLREKT